MSSSSHRPYSALYVEDYKPDRMALVNALQQAGIEAQGVRQPSEAIDLVCRSHGPIDAVILDLGLSGRPNGPELAKRLSLENRDRFRFGFFYTIQSEESELMRRARALEAEGWEIVVKNSFDIDSFVALILARIENG